MSAKPEYTIQPTFLRVVTGHVENEPDQQMIGIEVHDRRGTFTIPLPVPDARIMARLLLEVVNELREQSAA